MTRRSRAREVVLQMLFQHDFNPHLEPGRVQEQLRAWLRDPPLEPFALALYDRVVSRLPEIDARLTEAATNWRLPRMAAVDRNVLRLGACELLFTPETPPRVVLDEAIELARRYGSADSPAFINGVLDRLMQSVSAPPTPPADS
jgi:N utilization substance protein B